MSINETVEKSQAQFVALNAKAMDFAEANTKAVFGFAREALATKTPESFWSLQQTFMKSQQEAAVKQVEQFNSFYADWLKQTAAPMAEAMKPFMAKAA
jgi:hypothetical protein